MSGLKLSQRDDPLAGGPSTSTDPEPERAARGGDGRPDLPSPQPAPPVAAKVGPGGPYDDDPLEQCGWRLYAGLLAEIRDRAARLTKEGYPTSTAGYAGAVLGLRLPEDLDGDRELVREWATVTATRRSTRTSGAGGQGR